LVAAGRLRRVLNACTISMGDDMAGFQKDWERLLTPRERQVARLAATGLSNRAIAKKLGTAEGTVKFQAHTLFHKLGLANRTQLALLLGLRLYKLGIASRRQAIMLLAKPGRSRSMVRRARKKKERYARRPK
jgi:DNA-binding CsgD family transcriptional regulator